VPGAGNRVVVDRAVAQGPVVVRADVVQREELVADPNEHQQVFVDFDDHATFVGQIGRVGDRGELVRSFGVWHY
jgi:hypothetical protein